jgi:hypothetical protein
MAHLNLQQQILQDRTYKTIHLHLEMLSVLFKKTNPLKINIFLLKLLGFRN